MGNKVLITKNTTLFEVLTLIGEKIMDKEGNHYYLPFWFGEISEREDCLIIENKEMPPSLDGLMGNQ